MARIEGVDLPRNKRVEIGLTYIFGIGRNTSQAILGQTGINPDTRVVSAVVRSSDMGDLPATLEFELSHPAFVSRDQQVTLNRAMDDSDGNPVWVGHFLSIPSGRFYAVLKAGDDWRISAEWQGETSLMLRAGGAGNDDKP